MPVKIEYVSYWYGGVNFSFWQVRGEGFVKTNNFKTKSQAENWALENGYEIE